MRVVFTPIPANSFAVRVWRDVPPGDEFPEDKSNYQFACNLHHIDDDTCDSSLAIGEFDNDMAIAIGVKLAELGYKKLLLSRPHGHKATRWAEFSHTENGLDYYAVDLEAAMRKLNAQKR